MIMPFYSTENVEEPRRWIGRLLGQLNGAIEPLPGIRDGIGKDKGAGVGADRRPGNQVARSLNGVAG